MSTDPEYRPARPNRVVPNRAWRRAAVASSAGALLVFIAWQTFVTYARTLEFPQQLHVDEQNAAVVYDRGGQLLAQVRRDGKLSIPITRSEVPPQVVDTLLAAEDKRFYSHGGVDVLAMVRALGQMVSAGRIVSGASTLTQQLARSTFERPRTLAGKAREVALAVRIEAQLEKDEILVAYLNRIEFGPNLVGIGAAAQAYFAKPVSALSLSEAATLAAIPRGPTLYNPKRDGTPVKRRRDRILRRLLSHNPRASAEAERALALPVVLQEQVVWPGAFHWVRRLASAPDQAQVRTTLDAALQRRAESLVLTAVGQQGTSAGPTAAAVLVVDNRTRETLAYVGSPSYHALDTGGQNDGVVALRQPGSTLKPLVYASAMTRLGYTAATLLPDIPLEFRERGKVYAPRNYDGRFRGPVRLREALGNSLNVPAVHTAARIGPGPLLADLHKYGFASLTKVPEHYGVALALGDGEVRLEELVAAYAMLANGGMFSPLRLHADQTQHNPRRVLPETVAAIITDILRDPHARASAFGRHGPLEFAYPVAVKTGTSKGARDNWTIGFSERVTVGVWVGNFDGKPLSSSSGASAAAPLFNAVMHEAHERASAPTGRSAPTGAVGDAVGVRVCTLSGLLPNAHCPTTIREWFAPGTEPTTTDAMHVQSAVLHGALAPHCSTAQRRVFERYPPEYARWATEAGRPTLPQTVLSDCTHTPEVHDEYGKVTTGKPIVTFPRDGAVYRRVADEPVARQQLVLRATAPGASELTYVIDGRPFRTTGPPFTVEWPLTLGAHQVYVLTADGRRGRAVSFAVE